MQIAFPRVPSWRCPRQDFDRPWKSAVTKVAATPSGTVSISEDAMRWALGTTSKNGVSAGHSVCKGTTLYNDSDLHVQYESGPPGPVTTLGKLQAKVRAETKHYHR